MTYLDERFLGVAYPSNGTHFSKKRANSDDACNPQSGRPCRMSCLQCELSELLEASRPPDPELVDLIEQAFIQGQIDSKRAELAYLWLMGLAARLAQFQHEILPTIT